MPVTSRSLVRSTVVLLLAGLLALLGIVLSSFWLVERTRNYVGEVVAAREFRGAVADLRILLQDAETGQRGYLLTSEPSYLSPYDAARDGVEPKLQEVRRLSAGYPDMAGPLDDLEATIQEKLVVLDETIALGRSGQRDEALSIIDSDIGQRLMARARLIFDRLVDQADQRLDVSFERQRLSTAALRWVTIGGAFAIVLVVGGSVWTVLHYTRDLAAARSEVQALNTGLEERVRERTSDLGRANDEIQRFAYIVTHDLRAPLVNIMGFTSELEASLAPIQTLVKRAEERDDDQIVGDARTAAGQDLPEAIGFIRSSTKKMDGLINAILKLSRDGRRPLKPERIELDPLLQVSANSVQHQVDQADGVIDFDIRAPVIVSDRIALEQVFGNLLDNAVKYRSRERPLRLRIRAVPAFANRVSIEFQDNGRGIARQDHDRVFDLFRRSGSQDQTGEGIGLAHVRSVVRNLGGDITVESELGQGTTFRINLPLDLQAAIRSHAA